jgi:hypothetical protein
MTTSASPAQAARARSPAPRPSPAPRDGPGTSARAASATSASPTPATGGRRRPHQITGARARYDRRRAAGDHHNAALRNLANKLHRRIWWCLHNNQNWDEKSAWNEHSTDANYYAKPDPRLVAGASN